MLNGFMNKAVIDTNVLVALIDSNDKWHEKTPALLNILQVQNIGIVWFDCVINETISVLARRTEEQKRSGQFSSLLDTLIQMIPPKEITWISLETQRLYDDILEQILKSEGKLNFHDAMMAVCCHEYGINLIVSFDKDFDSITWLKRIEKPDDVLTKPQVFDS